MELRTILDNFLFKQTTTKKNTNRYLKNIDFWKVHPHQLSVPPNKILKEKYSERLQ